MLRPIAAIALAASLLTACACESDEPPPQGSYSVELADSGDCCLLTPGAPATLVAVIEGGGLPNPDLTLEWVTVEEPGTDLERTLASRLEAVSPGDRRPITLGPNGSSGQPLTLLEVAAVLRLGDEVVSSAEADLHWTQGFLPTVLLELLGPAAVTTQDDVAVAACISDADTSSPSLFALRFDLGEGVEEPDELLFPWQPADCEAGQVGARALFAAGRLPGDEYVQITGTVVDVHGLSADDAVTLWVGSCDHDADGDGYEVCDDCPEVAGDSSADIYPADLDGDGATACSDCNDDPLNGGATLNLRDDDGDGWSSCAGDCDDRDPFAFPENTETCVDGIDNDCNGEVDESYDHDGDGVDGCAGDCDETEPSVHPGAAEACDGRDTDCDGIVPDDELDHDGDGFADCDAVGAPRPGFIGGDCDDGAVLIYPGAPELCDSLDNDCDGIVDEEADLDGDGYGPCAGDCDDTNSTVRPDAEEACDGVDTDCDGALLSGEEDFDGDTFVVCDPDPRLAPGLEGGDCDDQSVDTFPGATEVCDGRDNDCDGQLPATELDADADGFPSCGDCDDGDPLVFPGSAERCNAEDDDCNGLVPASEMDLDADGFLPCDGDCDDADAARWPGAPELCNGIDDDCNGSADAAPGEWDADGDGFSPCEGDCIETDDLIHPGAPERCNGVDDDCDGVVPGVELDGDGDGWSHCAGDCDDGSALVSPGRAELCNGVDDDCDGLVDSADPETDSDGDGVSVCSGDCNDASPLAAPGLPEVCDGVDNDCDAAIDEGFDADSDGVADCFDLELCDGVDNDGNGLIDEVWDSDGDGVTECGPDGVYATQDDDCDDNDPSLSPTLPEACDGLDNDCDGVPAPDEVDEDCNGVLDCNQSSLAPLVAVAPGSVGFADTAVGCGSTAAVQVTNLTNCAQELDVAALGTGFSVPASTSLSVPANGGGTVNVVFEPPADQNYSGEVLFTSPGGQQQSVPLSGAGTGGATGAAVLDRPPVDVLFIIDNSCSMGDELDVFRPVRFQIADWFYGTDLDFHVGVRGGSGGWLRQLSSLEPSPNRWLHLNTVDPTPSFGPFWMFADYGGGENLIYQLDFFANAQNNPLAHDYGFLRPEADFVVVMMSDEDDQSSGSVPYWLSQIRAALPPDKPLRVHSVVQRPGGTCGLSNGWRIAELGALTGGNDFDICLGAPTWLPSLLDESSMGVPPSAIELVPAADANTLVVLADGQPISGWSCSGTPCTALDLTNSSLPGDWQQVQVDWDVAPVCSP